MTALILDCDGVLAETERHLHLPAFNQAFEELSIPIRWSDAEYAEKLLVSGGKERMATSLTPTFAADHGLPADGAGREELLDELHARKTRIFEELLRENPPPARPGIARIIGAADAAGWSVAIASTSAEAAVEAVLLHAVGRSLAQRVAVFAGDVVPAKKPDPAIYELALAELGVTVDEAIAIEDSRNGLLAATSAGLSCVITISDYTAAEDFGEAALVLSALGDPGEPMTVIANRTARSVGGYLELEDLEAITTVARRRDGLAGEGRHGGLGV